MKMNVVSFDLGTKNLAYVLITSENQLHFKLIDVDSQIKRKENKALGRCRVLSEVMKDVMSLINNSLETKIVIEKQIKRNINAMNLMYSLLTIAQTYTNNVILFSPNQKFKLLNIEYSTVNKAHKKLSIQLTKELMKEHYPESGLKFNELIKKDDVADAFLMSYLSSNY
jgi:hypothetical protein